MPTVNFIYLGNFTDYDTNESNYGAENIGDFDGEFVGNDVLQIVTVTENDANLDGSINDNDNGDMSGDSLSYTLNGSPQNNMVIDSTFSANVDAVLGDGTTYTFEAILVQMENGDIFLGDMWNNGSADNLNIQSVEISGITGGGTTIDYSGLVSGSSASNTAIVCFTAGTRLLSARGYISVEDLAPGDRLLTKDRGLQPIQWIASQSKTSAEMRQHSQLRPVRISKGALGDNRPNEDLYLSQQHRVLCADQTARAMFSTSEVLISAKKLTALDGVEIVEGAEPQIYFHIYMGDHDIIYANGQETETLLLGAEAIKTLPTRDASAIAALAQMEGALGPPKPARMIPSGRAQKDYAQRRAAGQTGCCAIMAMTPAALRRDAINSTCA